MKNLEITLLIVLAIATIPVISVYATHLDGGTITTGTVEIINDTHLMESGLVINSGGSLLIGSNGTVDFQGVLTTNIGGNVTVDGSVIGSTDIGLSVNGLIVNDGDIFVRCGTINTVGAPNLGDPVEFITCNEVGFTDQVPIVNLTVTNDIVHAENRVWNITGTVTVDGATLTSLGGSIENYGLIELINGGLFKTNPTSVLTNYCENIDGRGFDPSGGSTTGSGSIIDTVCTAPVVSLIGGSTLQVMETKTYTEFGATCFDAEDGQINGSVVISGDVVDTGTIGTYFVNYDCEDSEVNPVNANQVIRTVNVVEEVEIAFSTVTQVATVSGISDNTINYNLNFLDSLTTDSETFVIYEEYSVDLLKWKVHQWSNLNSGFELDCQGDNVCQDESRFSPFELFFTKSSNNGVTWSTPISVSTSIKTNSGAKILESSGDLTIVTPYRIPQTVNDVVKIIRSENGGTTWGGAGNSQPTEVLSEVFLGTNIEISQEGDLIYVTSSTDGTFETVPATPTGTVIIPIATARSQTFNVDPKDSITGIKAPIEGKGNRIPDGMWFAREHCAVAGCSIDPNENSMAFHATYVPETYFAKKNGGTDGLLTFTSKPIECGKNRQHCGNLNPMEDTGVYFGKVFNKSELDGKLITTRQGQSSQSCNGAVPLNAGNCGDSMIGISVNGGKGMTVRIYDGALDPEPTGACGSDCFPTDSPITNSFITVTTAPTCNLPTTICTSFSSGTISGTPNLAGFSDPSGKATLVYYMQDTSAHADGEWNIRDVAIGNQFYAFTTQHCEFGISGHGSCQFHAGEGDQSWVGITQKVIRSNDSEPQFTSTVYNTDRTTSEIPDSYSTFNSRVSLNISPSIETSNYELGIYDSDYNRLDHWKGMVFANVAQTIYHKFPFDCGAFTNPNGDQTEYNTFNPSCDTQHRQNGRQPNTYTSIPTPSNGIINVILLGQDIIWKGTNDLAIQDTGLPHDGYVNYDSLRINIPNGGSSASTLGSGCCPPNHGAQPTKFFGGVTTVPAGLPTFTDEGTVAGTPTVILTLTHDSNYMDSVVSNDFGVTMNPIVKQTPSETFTDFEQPESIINNGTNIYSVATGKVGTDITNSLIFSKSTDSGDTWATQRIDNVSFEPTDTTPQILLSSNGTHIAVIYTENGEVTITKSTDSGDTWNTPEILADSDTLPCIDEQFAVQSSFDTIYFECDGTSGGKYITTSSDFGETYTTLTLTNSTGSQEYSDILSTSIVSNAKYDSDLSNTNNVYLIYSENGTKITTEYLFQVGNKYRPDTIEKFDTIDYTFEYSQNYGQTFTTIPLPELTNDMKIQFISSFGDKTDIFLSEPVGNYKGNQITRIDSSDDLLDRCVNNNICGENLLNLDRFHNAFINDGQFSGDIASGQVFNTTISEVLDGNSFLLRGVKDGGILHISAGTILTMGSFGGTDAGGTIIIDGTMFVDGSLLFNNGDIFVRCGSLVAPLSLIGNVPVDIPCPSEYETYTQSLTGDTIYHTVINIAIDVTEPVITLLGDNPQEVVENMAYIEAGALCIDDIDGDISIDVIQGGSVNTGQADTYFVTYDCQDRSEHDAIQAVRTVNVVSGNIGGSGDGGGTSSQALITSQGIAQQPIFTTLTGLSFSSGSEVAFSNADIAVMEGKSAEGSLEVAWNGNNDLIITTITVPEEFSGWFEFFGEEEQNNVFSQITLVAEPDDLRQFDSIDYVVSPPEGTEPIQYIVHITMKGQDSIGNLFIIEENIIVDTGNILADPFWIWSFIIAIGALVIASLWVYKRRQYKTRRRTKKGKQGSFSNQLDKLQMPFN